MIFSIQLDGVHNEWIRIRVSNNEARVNPHFRSTDSFKVFKFSNEMMFAYRRIGSTVNVVVLIGRVSSIPRT